MYPEQGVSCCYDEVSEDTVQPRLEELSLFSRTLW